MEATSDYRSMVGAMSTSLPGVEFGGLLPNLSRHAHEMTIVRSFRHSNADHLGASHYVLTAHDAPGGVQRQQSPSFGSVAARVRGASHPLSGVPTFVRLSRTISFDFDQPLWPGVGNSLFDADGPSRSSLNMAVDASRLNDRQNLLQELDRVHRELDQSGLTVGMDSFRQQALDLVSGGVRHAFDISKEAPRLRERYGPRLGAQLLAARRLCEAGCGFVMLNYGWAPNPAETPFTWDMHLGPGQLRAPRMEQQLQSMFPMFDQAVSAFLDDVRGRGLNNNILLVVTGDFGRTPKINTFGGRDHWPDLCTLALAGGGLTMVQVIGTSSARAEYPTSRMIEPKDLMATLFHVLRIAADIQFEDFSGRPRYLLPEGAKVISELI